MGKGTKKKRCRDETTWSREDHELRQDRNNRAVSAKKEHRQRILSHYTRDNHNSIKLKLHITKTQREIENLRKRLKQWDPVEEAEIKRKRLVDEEKRLRQDDGEPQPQKRRGRKGPETWKLKGAARPASEIYDFDTRYVDPHMKAHKQAEQKVSRSLNVLAEQYHATFLEKTGQVGRGYLGLLMQLGHLSLEKKQFKTSRACFLEVMQLEGCEPITTARDSLMRMYMQLGRTEAAVRLGERLQDDTSVWIRYSHALAVHLQRVELGGTTTNVDCLVSAVRANPFCAFYLAFNDVFSRVMEYTEDLEDTEDVPQSSLEEAIEYCSSGAAKAWEESGAASVVRTLLSQASRGSNEQLKPADVEWSERLDKIEADFDSRHNCSEGDEHKDVEDGESSAEDEEAFAPDVKMYAGMFRTAMEMLQESGQMTAISATKP
jgi:hypothetical protein